MDNTETASPFNKRQGYRDLLTNRNFLFLWLGQMFSQLADRVIFVVFVAVIANSFGTSTSMQSWLYVAFTIPAILLTAVAGVFIDRWNKKYTLIITNILRAIIIALLPFFDNSLFQIYALAFLLSSVTQFFVPAEASTIPMIVDKYQLLMANSLFTTTMMGSIIFGFALGDPLINIFGLQSVHIAISVFFAIAAISLTLIKYKPIDSEGEHHKTFKEFYDDLKQGFTYTKNNPVVHNAMFKLATLFSIIVMMSILAIGLSQEKLYPQNPALGAQKFVYIIAFSGIGMVLGAFLVGKIFRDIEKYRMIYSGFTIIALNLLLMTFIGFIPQELHLNVPQYTTFGIYFEEFNLTARMIYTYFLATWMGLGAAFVAIPVQTILHSSVDEDVRGKVFGVQFTLLSTSSTLPVLVAAMGADVIGVTKMLLMISIPLLFYGLRSLYSLKKTN